MRMFRVLTSLALAWIGLLCVVLSAPAQADPIGIVTPGADIGQPLAGVANAPASKLRTNGSDAGLRRAYGIGDARTGIPSGVDSGAARPTGANGAQVEQRFRATGACATSIGYSDTTGPQQSHPSAWQTSDPRHRPTMALCG
jgi:hypothetical protein